MPLQPENNYSDEDDHSNPDSNYDPLEKTENVEDYHHCSYILRNNALPEEERQFLVSESFLASILGKCDFDLG